jgi:hypothetical protein
MKRGEVGISPFLKFSLINLPNQVVDVQIIDPQTGAPELVVGCGPFMSTSDYFCHFPFKGNFKFICIFRQINLA